MRIYVCIPVEFFESENFVSSRKNFCRNLSHALKKYYGRINPLDIEFFKNSSDRSDRTDFYIMENSKRQGFELQIQEIIKNLFIKYFPGLHLNNICLNYQRAKPDFRPSDLLSENKKSDEFDYEKLSLNYKAQKARYNFNQVILSEDTLEKVKEAADMVSLSVREKVFEEWGLKNIIPHAASALNFYGSPGTGKTMLAEAVADYLKKKIIRATYADIESKYHGEGPKMVKAIFLAAKREDAVLFIDESDALLSKRLTNVTDGSAQAINSMRSQLLISLEQFDGIVIFASNLVINYDKAFLSRLISVEIPDPDVEARKSIWERHMFGEGIKIPFAEDVQKNYLVSELAEKYKEFCGREIKNAVLHSCVSAARRKNNQISKDDIINACERVKTEAEKVRNAADHTQSKNHVTQTIQNVLNNSK